MPHAFVVTQLSAARFTIAGPIAPSEIPAYPHGWPEESVILHPAPGLRMDEARARWLTAPERRWVVAARSLPDTIAGLPVFPLWNRHPTDADPLPLWGLFPRTVLQPWLDRGWIAPRVDSCWVLGFELTEAGDAVRRATRAGHGGRLVLCLPEGGAPASPFWGARLVGWLDRIAAALPPPGSAPPALARWLQAAEAAVAGLPLPPGLPRDARHALVAYFQGVRPMPTRDPWPTAQWRAWARQWVRIAQAHGVLTAHGWLLGRLAQAAEPGPRRARRPA